MNVKKYYTMQGFTERLNRLIYIDNDMNCVYVSKIIGCDRKTIYAWLNGISLPNALMVARLCLLFNISADELLGIGGGKNDIE